MSTDSDRHLHMVTEYALSRLSETKRGADEDTARASSAKVQLAAAGGMSTDAVNAAVHGRR